MSPRNAEKDRMLRERRRKEILDAALYAIARKGLSGTKISDIAEAAGLSVGYVYKHFVGKEELFAALVERGQLEYRAFAEEALRKPLSPYDRLLWYTKEWFQYRNGWAITIILAHARTSEAVPYEIKKTVSARFVDNLKPIAQIIEEGQKSGDFVDGDSMELALIYVSLMEGLILHDIPEIREIASLAPESALRLLCRRTQNQG
jgi:TetR/AcrR family hemagglutinin/protease transcriptional regulator